MPQTYRAIDSVSRLIDGGMNERPWAQATGLGPEKATRLQRTLPLAYDRIVIGGRREVEGAAGTRISADPAHGSVRPQWRRGHFRRIRFGEGLSESRLGWIRPVLVNAAEAFAPVPVKGYEVR